MWRLFCHYLQWHSHNGNIFMHIQKILKIMPQTASKIVVTLKGKNLLPEGANSFLKRNLYSKEVNYFMLIPQLILLHCKCFTHASGRLCLVIVAFLDIFTYILINRNHIVHFWAFKYCYTSKTSWPRGYNHKANHKANHKEIWYSVTLECVFVLFVF